MSRSRISNPGKLRRIAALLGRPVTLAFYRGGHSDPDLGHFFTVYCSDGTAWFVSSKLNKFEQDTDPPTAARASDGTEWHKAIGQAADSH